MSQPPVSGFITVEGFPQTLPQRLLQRIQALRRAGREVPALDDRVARRARPTHLRQPGRAGSPSAHREHPLDREQLRVLLLCDHHRARHAPAAPTTELRRSAPLIAGWPRERPGGKADPLGWW